MFITEDEKIRDAAERSVSMLCERERDLVDTLEKRDDEIARLKENWQKSENELYDANERIKELEGELDEEREKGGE